jgi:CHAD domain-containing protein
MAKQLSNKVSGTRGVQRLLRKQLEAALEALRGEAGLSDEAVHTVRKQLKKVRASLRLLRPALGSQAYNQENATYRDAARPFTRVRDAKVLIDTLDQLVAGNGDQAMALDSTPVRQVLQQDYQAIRCRVLEDDALESVQAILPAARQRAKQWPVGQHGWSVLGAGLRRVYRRGREAFRAVQEQPSDEHLHEWRKQVKYLWHQLQVLQPLQPARITALADHAHTLADALGDDHDLAVLHQWLVEEADRFPDRNIVDALLGRIAYRRVALQAQAMALGPGLYTEKPSVFVDRCRGDGGIH